MLSAFCDEVLFPWVSHLYATAGLKGALRGYYPHIFFLLSDRWCPLTHRTWVHLVTSPVLLSETYPYLCWPVGILAKSDLSYFSVFLLLPMPSGCPDHNLGLSKKRKKKILLTRSTNFPNVSDFHLKIKTDCSWFSWFSQWPRLCVYPITNAKRHKPQPVWVFP